MSGQTVDTSTGCGTSQSGGRTVSVSEGGGRWRIVLPADFEIAGLWKLLAGEGLNVRKLTHRRDTLEEIFLKAVGHIQHTPGEAAAAAEEVAANGRL